MRNFPSFPGLSGIGVPVRFCGHRPLLPVRYRVHRPLQICPVYGDFPRSVPSPAPLGQEIRTGARGALSFSYTETSESCFISRLYVTNDAPKSLPFPDHSAIGRKSEGGFWFRQVRWALIGSVEMAVSRGGICRNWSDRHFPSRIISSSQSGLCVSIAEIHAALIPTI